jgi:hypothetical protein
MGKIVKLTVPLSSAMSCSGECHANFTFVCFFPLICREWWERVSVQKPLKCNKMDISDESVDERLWSLFEQVIFFFFVTDYLDK